MRLQVSLVKLTNNLQMDVKFYSDNLDMFKNCKPHLSLFISPNKVFWASELKLSDSLSNFKSKFWSNFSKALELEC